MSVSWFAGLLALVFIGLKLGAVGVVAGWSWTWVLSPIWILVLGALAYVICALLISVATHIKK